MAVYQTPTGLPYELDGVDRYWKYQTVDEPAYAAFLDRQHQALRAAGLPGMFVDVCKAGHGTAATAQLASDNAQQSRLANGRPWYIPGKYWWLLPGPDSYIISQAKLAAQVMQGLGRGWFMQCDAEEGGLTSHMVRLFCDVVAQIIGRPICQYGREWTDANLYPIWRAWYHGTPTSSASAFTSSINYILSHLGYTPTLLQWGGGGEGAFVPGLNGGRSRVDSNIVFDWARVLHAAGRDLPPPPPSPPPRPSDGLIYSPAPPQEPTVALELITEPDPVDPTRPKVGAPQWIVKDRFQKWWLRDGRFPSALGAGPLQIMSAEVINAIPNVSAVPDGWTDHRS